MADKNVSSIPDSLRNFESLPDSAAVAQPTVEALFSISAATVWRRVHSGDLPQPERHGKRTTRWNVGKLRAVLNGAGAAQ